MFDHALLWFKVVFEKDFRQKNIDAFQTFTFLALAHFFGFYNPKQVADYLEVPFQELYRHLRTYSLHTLQKMLVRFMVKQAAEKLRPLMGQSASTWSRAGVSMSVDNSVIDRFGRLLRWTWSWYSGRFKKVVNGHDLLGVILTVGGIAIPLNLMFCSKQGRGNTDKPSLLISMLALLIEEFAKEGIDITDIPITMDSWFASNDLREKLYELGFTKIIVAGKGNFVFVIDDVKKSAAEWKKTIAYETDVWGVDDDLPCKRTIAYSPTFGLIALFFYQKSNSRNYYLMDLSKTAMRGAEIWRIWKQHHIIEAFWKTLKSVLQIKAMRLRADNSQYAALLIKVIAYLMGIRLRETEPFFNMTITRIIRTVSRDYDLRQICRQHFHHLIL